VTKPLSWRVAHCDVATRDVAFLRASALQNLADQPVEAPQAFHMLIFQRHLSEALDLLLEPTDHLRETPHG